MSELQTPEMTAWVQAIASSTFHEHIQDIADEQMEKVYDKFREDRLMRLERDFNAHRDRTEERFDRLENALTELAEAQKRTEDRLVRLENVVAELAEAQKRTEKRIDDLDHRVGLVGNLLGLEAEGEAEETMVYILEQKGYQLLDAPYALAVDGIEIDVVAPVEGPDGERVSVLVDVKARARLKELRRWAGRLQDAAFQEQLVEAGVAKPFLPYFFGLRVYQIVDQEANRLGIGVVDPNGERVEPTLLR